jgi:hypothetical protein
MAASAKTHQEQSSDPLQLENFDDPNEEDEESIDPSSYRGMVVGASDWTVQTLISQIRARNIDLAPRYQRRSAWNDVKRSRYIESLILGVPVPQLVLAEQADKQGRFVVIDGKQRLLTIAGLDELSYSFWTARRLKGLLSLNDLDGISIDDFLIEPRFADYRRRLDNRSIRAALIVGFKTDDVLYDIFYRLNSGSVPLSGQELRQTLLRGPFTDYLFDVTNRHQPIHDVMNIKGPDQRMYDAELVLRFLAESLGVVSYAGNLKKYLDDTTTTFNENWERDEPRVKVAYDDLNRGIEHLTKLLNANEVGRRRLANRFEGRLNKALLEVELYYFSKLNSVAKSKTASFDGALKELCARRSFANSIETTTKSVERFRTRFTLFGKEFTKIFRHTIDLPLIK